MITNLEISDAKIYANKKYLTVYEEKMLLRFYLQLETHNKISVKSMVEYNFHNNRGLHEELLKEATRYFQNLKQLE